MANYFMTIICAKVNYRCYIAAWSLIFLLLLSACASDTPSDKNKPDVKDIIVKPVRGLLTSEDGGSAEFTLSLTNEPSKSVSIEVVSKNVAEGTVEPAQALFNATNWDQPQSFTVTGQDDDLVDGDVSYFVELKPASSGDSDYDGIDPHDVELVNSDNDVAPVPNVFAITVEPESLTTNRAGEQAQFNVKLTGTLPPTAAVSIDLTVNDPGNSLTIEPNPVIFNAVAGDQWDTMAGTSQAVTITDNTDMAAASVSYTIIASASNSDDQNYNGISVADVSVNSPFTAPPPVYEILVAPLQLTTNRGGDTASFDITLKGTHPPSQDVTIGLSLSDSTSNISIPAEVIFPPVAVSQWDAVIGVKQTVSVTDNSDAMVTSNQSYTIITAAAVSAAEYTGIDPADITLESVYTPPAGDYMITVEPVTGLETSENQTTANFTVTLKGPTKPDGIVTIALSSSKPQEGVVTPEVLSFDASGIIPWDSTVGMSLTATITGVDDTLRDGDQAYQIITGPAVESGNSVPKFTGIDPPDVDVLNLDNEPPLVVDYRLFIREGEIAFDPSKTNDVSSIPVLSFSSTETGITEVPARTVIEAIAGDTINIEVTNLHIKEHNFVIHGISMGGDETPIPPNGTKMYSISVGANEEGVYLYSDTLNNQINRAVGLYGAVIVKPAQNSNTRPWAAGPTFDSDRTWVITDMDQERWNNVELFGNATPTPVVDTTVYKPNFFLINGMGGFNAMHDATTEIRGAVDDVFLVRIVNAGQFDQSLHFHGNHFQVISKDGERLGEPNMQDTINVKAGRTAMVLYTIKQLGEFPMHVHTAQMETANGVYLNGTATMIIGE